jgi:phosphomannomutase/phosphoglucomutase
VKDVCEKYGGALIYTKVGAPYLSEAVLSNKAVSGGEEVGGIIWPELSLAKDGFMASAKIAEAVAEKPLSEWMAELPEYFNSKCKIEARPEDKARLLAAAEKDARANGLKVNATDGVRIDFPDSWVIIRASGTENYFRVFAEAKSAGKAKALMDEYRERVEKLLRGR